MRRFEASRTYHVRRFTTRVSCNSHVLVVRRFLDSIYAPHKAFFARVFVYLARRAFYRPCIRILAAPGVLSPVLLRTCRVGRFIARISAPPRLITFYTPLVNSLSLNPCARYHVDQLLPPFWHGRRGWFFFLFLVYLRSGILESTIYLAVLAYE